LLLVVSVAKRKGNSAAATSKLSLACVTPYIRRLDRAKESRAIGGDWPLSPALRN
jgi:hypothetical protein